MDKDKLRSKAEALYKEKAESIDHDSQKVLEELKIHQIELQLQNIELRDNQEKLELARHKFIKIFENAPVGYLILNHKGVVQNVNQTLCDILDYDKSEMIGIPFYGFIHTDDQKEFMLRYKAFFSEPKDKRFTIKILKRDDEILYAELKGNKENFLLDSISNETDELLFINLIDVSNRMALDKKRQQITNRYEILFHQSSVGIAEVLPDGSYIQVNQRYSDICGYTVEELQTMNFRDISHPEDGDVDEDHVSKLISGEANSYSLDKRIVHKSGKIVWVRLYTSVIRDRFGNIQYAIASIIDINAEKLHQDELEETNARLKLAMASAKEGLWQWNLKDDSFYFDENAHKMLGYDDSYTRKGSVWVDKIHPEDLPRVKERINDYLSGRKDNYSVKFRLPRKDGVYIWILSVGMVTKRDNEGNPLIFTGIHQDITSKIKKDSELKQLEYIFDTIQDPISILDKNYRYIHVNESYEKFYGKPVNEINGKLVEDLMGKESFYKSAKPHLDRALSGEKIQYQSWFKFGDNEPFYHDVIYYPFFDKNNEVTHIIVSSRDLTKQKLAEFKLKETEYLIEQIYNVSTPLCYITSDYIIERANSAFCRLFEVELANVVGKKCFEVIDNQICNCKECMMKQVLTFDKKYEYEMEKKLPSGNILTCKVTAQSIKNEKFELLGILETFTDISALKQAQNLLSSKKEEVVVQNEELQAQNEELIESYQQQSILVNELERAEEVGKFGSFSIDLIKEQGWWSKNLYVLHGYEPEEMAITMQVQKKVIYEEDREQALKNFDNLIKSSEISGSNIFRIVRKDGQLRYMKIDYNVDKDKSGNPLRVNGTSHDITEEREIQMKLEISERRLKFLSEVSLEGILVTENFIVQDANQAVLNMTGYTREEIIGKELLFFFPDSIDKEMIREEIKKDIPGPNRMLLERKDKSIFPAESICRNIEYKGKHLRVSSIRDLTNQVEIENKLALAESKFQTYIENAPSGFFVADQNGNYLEVNDSACKITGYSKEELLKKNLADLIPDFDKELALKHFNDLKTKNYSNNEIHFIHKSGKIKCWNVIAQKITEDRFIAFTNDVTERKEAEEAKKESDSLLGSAIDSIPVPVLIAKAPDVEIIHCNQAALELLSKEVDDVKNITLDDQRDFWPSFYPDGTPFYAEDLPLTQAIKHGTITTAQEVIVRKNNKDRWISVSAAPLFDDDGNIIAGIIVFPEITKLKEITEELRTQQELLNQVENISHIGGWEIEIPSGKAKWTRGIYNIVEIEYSDAIPGIKEHLEYYLPQYKDMISKKIDALVNDGVNLEFEAELVTAKGNKKWCKAYGRRKSEKGICTKIYGTFQDITATVELEKEMRQKNAQIDSLLNNTSDFILLSDKTATPVLFNKAYKDIIKRAFNIDIKHGVKPDFHPEDTERNKILQEWTERVLSGESFKTEYDLQLPDGEVICLEISFSPVIENGEVLGYSEVSRDITLHKKQKKHLEKLVKERTQRLEIQNEDLIRMNKLFTGREFRIKELRDQLKELKEKMKEY